MITLLSYRPWLNGAKSLLLHPLRSLLTVLGIFIGTASVIWLLAIGAGISAKAQEQIESLGAENIIVRSVKPPSGGGGSSRSGALVYGLTREDFALIKETIPTIKLAMPMREVRREFRYQQYKMQGRLVACTSQYAEMTKLDIEVGHFLTELDEQNLTTVCVLGAGTAKQLFPLKDPIGETIQVHHERFQVIGIVKDRAPTAAIGGSLSAQDFQSDIYIPLSTFQARIGDLTINSDMGAFSAETVELTQATFQVDSPETVLATSKIVEQMLAKRHPKNDVKIVVPLELLEKAKTTRLMFMVFMGLIAAISLVVGGIGIMNIMLATVTERTKEIGIRRALGAKQSDITQQFLVETMVLSVAGGATGVLGGLTCPRGMDLVRSACEKFIPEVFSQLPPEITTVTPTVVPISVPIAFCISVGIGVLFGLYPAIRAAKLDPIEALRHD